MGEKRIIAIGSTEPVRLIEWLRKLGLLDREKVELPASVEVTRTPRGIYTVTEAES